MDLFDTSGHEKYESLISIIFRDSDIIFIFFNHNNNKSFQRAKYFFDLAKNRNASSTVFVLIANKYQEKNYSKKNDDILNEEEVLEFVRDNNLIYGHLSILEKYSNGINILSFFNGY